MDYEKLNPCSYERLVRLVAWAETGCWCCTSLRALLVGLWIGVTVGLSFGSKPWGAAMWFFILGGAVVYVALRVARRIWAESYKVEENQSP